MTKRERLYVLSALFFAVVVALTCAFTLSACKNNKDKDDTVSGTGKYGVGEEGTYYSVDLDTEYILILTNGTYTLTMENIANSEGTYLYYTESGTIVFTGSAGEEFTGTFAEGSINLTTDAGTYLFQPKTTAKVSFVVNGTEVARQDVTIGMTATAIDNPAVPDGYAFGGWYTDRSYTTRYSFSTAVTGNVTLYAKLIEIDPTLEVYKVAFVNGSTTTYGETVNSTVILPSDEVLGWWVCWDGDPTMPMYIYEEDTTVSEDTTLVAVANGSIGASVYGDKITVQAQVMTWNVYITASDGTFVDSFSSSSSSYTYAFSSLDAGIYTVEVSAQGFTTERLTYVSGALDKVSVIYAQDEYLIFKAVENATFYTVKVTYGNTVATATIDASTAENEYLALDISGYEMQKDGISFTITASADGYISSTSKTFVLIRELDKVTGLTIDSAKDEATWTTVESATAYEVSVAIGTGSAITATTTETTYSFKYYNKGDVISVTVKPVASGYYSDESSAATGYTKATIAAPQNITVAGTEISWDAVTDAEVVSYIVDFNGTQITVPSGTQLDLSSGTYTIEDTNTISVKAVASNDDESSQWSDTITVAGGENASTVVSYLGDGVVSWNYIFGISNYTVTLTTTNNAGTGVTAGSAGTPNGNTADVTFSASGDVTITVSWTTASGAEKSAYTTVTVYSVSFDSNGGNSVSTQYYVQGDKMNLPDGTYNSSDYTFGGWYTAEHTGGIDPEEYVGEGYLVQSGDTFMWAQDVTLYAYWPSVRFTVTLVIDKAYELDSASSANGAFAEYVDVNYGSLPEGSYYTDVDDEGHAYVYVTVAKGSTTYVLPTPESDDAAYAFVGWFSNLYITYGHYWTGYKEGVGQGTEGNGISTQTEEDGYRYADFNGNATKAVSSDITLYAKWAQVLDFELSSMTYNGETVLSVGAHYENEKIWWDDGKEGEGNYSDTNLLIYYGLTEITVPETYTVDGVEYVVGYVGSSAFTDCTTLEVINLPDTIRYISISGDGYSEGNGAFAGDGNLKAVNIYETSHHTEGSSDETLFFSDEGVLYQYSTTYGYLELVYYPQGKTGDYKIPSELSNSGDIGTDGNVRIKTVGGIGTYVFTGKNIGTLTIAESVVKIGARAFSGSGVQTIAFLEGTTSGTLTIGDYAFENSTSLTTINLPVQLGNFNVSFFSGCSALTTITTTMTGYRVSSDGALLGDNGVTLVYFPAALSFADGAYTTPSTVTKIGAGAFANNTKLTTLTISASVTTIESYAFYGCNNLVTLTFMGTANSNPLTIESYAFYGDSKLESSASDDSSHSGYLVLPANLVKLEKYAFGGCTKITKVYYDSKDSDIDFENYAFSTDGATSADSSITIVELGANVPEMAITSIFGGNSLTTVTIDVDENGNNDYYYTDSTTGAIYGKTSKNLIYLPSSVSGAFTFTSGYEPTIIYADMFKGTGITSIVIPATVVEIQSSAFYGCSALAIVTFAAVDSDDTTNQTLSIGDYAFCGCSVLTSIELPGYVSYIGTGVFDGCSSLATISIKELTDGQNNGSYGVKSGILYEFANAGAGVYATRIIVKPALSTITEYTIYATIDGGITADFFSGVGITSLTFEGEASSTFYIEAGAFSGNTTLTTVVLPEGLKTIADSTFSGCTALTSVVIPSTVTTIESSAFANCTALSTVTFSDVEEGAARDTLNFVRTATTAAINNYDGAFYGTTALKSVSLPDNTVLNDYAFGSSGLMSITVPAGGTTTIPQYAFYGCSSLETVVLAEGITGIEKFAFASCGSIKNFTIPSTLTSINFSDAFNTADAQYYYTVNVGNTSYKAQDGILYSINSSGVITGMVQWSKYTTSATIPNAITEVEVGLFAGSAIETLVFEGPITFTNISYPTDTQPNETISVPFSSCNSLKSVTFTEAQTYSPYLFYNCTSLETVNVPATVTEIEDHTFYNCSSLTTIVFADANKITSVGDYAFWNCTSLTTLKDASGTAVTLTAAASVGDYAFYAAALTTFVTPGATEIGTYAFAHSKVASVTLASGLDAVAASTFEECDCLTSVSIPSKVTTMGSRAFYGCDLLATVTIAEGITKIGGYAFYGCVALTSVVVPLSVTTIEQYAFYGCSSLANVTFGETNAEGKSVLNSIEGYAFANTAITSFSFPDTQGEGESVEITLGEEIFGGLDLSELYISVSVKEVGDSLRNCTVAHFTVAEGHTEYHTSTDGTSLLDSNDNEVKGPVKTGSVTIDSDVEAYAYQNQGITGVTITASVSIGDHAFENCADLAEVTISGDVTVTLGDYAFYGCTLLTSIDLGAFSSIGEYAFANCTSLETVTFAEGSTFGDHMFDGDTTLETVDITEVATLSRKYAFSGSGVKTVVWGTRTSVPEYFFAGAANLTKLVTDSSGDADASSNITTLSEGSFYGCESLETFLLATSITSIPAYAFYGCGKLSLVIPSTVTTLNEYSLAGCGIDSENSSTGQLKLAEGCFAGSNITSFSPTSAIESVPDYAFYGCTSLESVSNIGTGTGSVATTNCICKYAFYGCTALTSFTFSNLWVFQDYAFAYSGLTSITYDCYRNMMATTSGVGTGVFEGCASLTTIDFQKGAIIYNDMFKNCTSLENVRWNNSSSNCTIYSGAFEGCTSLTTIYNNTSKTITNNSGRSDINIVSGNWSIS